MERKFNECPRSPNDPGELKWSLICKGQDTYISNTKENVIHRIIHILFK